MNKEPLVQSAAPLLLVVLFAAYCYSLRKQKSGGEATIHTNRTRRWSSAHSSASTHDTINSSSSSCSFSEEGSTEDGGGSDDILEAVALLFRDEDELNREERRRDVGTIVARIIPKDRIGFEEKKPLGHRRDDPQLLRRMLEERNGTPNNDFGNEGLEWRNEDLEDKLVSLHVQLSLSPQSMAQVSKKKFCRNSKGIVGVKAEDSKNQHVDLKLLRGAKESAKKTLHRLHLSIAKRLGCGTHKGNALSISKGKKDPAIFPSSQQRASAYQRASAQSAGTISTEPSVWVRESSSMADSFDDEEEGSAAAAFSAPQLQPSLSQRRFCLGNGNDKVPASLSSTTSEMQSACLWNELAEFEGSCLYFGIHPSGPLLPLEVYACPPTILSVKVFEDFQSRLYAGVPIVVEPALLHATHAQVAWFIEDSQGERSCIQSSWVAAAESSSSFTPGDEMIGKSISVLIVPTRPGHNGMGFEEAYKFHHLVEAMPPMPIVSPLRDAWTATRQQSQSNPNLRILSYNLLADWYAGRAIEASRAASSGKCSKRPENFYSFCDADFLVRERRFPMLVREIMAYQPDLVCLQEVDEKIFDQFFMPVLRTRGYQGYFSSKASCQSEGCAMFWSLKVFESAGAYDMLEFHLCNFFHECECDACAWTKEQKTEKSAWDECIASIRQLLKTNQTVREVLTSKTGQVVQIACLRPRCNRNNDSKKSDALIVGNTHLFYHPMADHIRAIQAYEVCWKLETIRRQLARKRCNTSMIVCGDLNSNPRSGAAQLLLQGRLGPDHCDAWQNLNKYTWEMGGEEYLFDHGYIGSHPDDNNELAAGSESFDHASKKKAEVGASVCGVCAEDAPAGLSLHFPPTFPRLISGYRDMPEFTNFSVGFAETLDYILVSEPSKTSEFGFRPVDTAAMPTTADMQGYVAMPNEFMPSDHVSISCDLAWIRRRSQTSDD